MIQDKNKLSEVGLEPDKPKGHIRAIWALTLIFVFALIVGAGVYFILWCSPWGENVLVNKSTTTPTATLSGSPTISSQPAIKYKTYINSDLSKFSFEYPGNLYVYPDFEEYSGVVSILKKGNDNVLTATKIEIKDSYLASNTADIRVAYLEINKSDISGHSNSKVEDATVGGVPALKLSYTDINDIGYFFVKDNFFYEISAWTNRMTEETSPLSDSTIKAAFDHLVSSFKFQ